MIISFKKLTTVLFGICRFFFVRSDDQSVEQCCTGYVWNENLKQCESKYM